MVVLYGVRHGVFDATASTANDCIQNIWQAARQIEEHYSSHKMKSFLRIWRGPAVRAARTAEILRDQLGALACSVIQDARLDDRPGDLAPFEAALEQILTSDGIIILHEPTLIYLANRYDTSPHLRPGKWRCFIDEQPNLFYTGNPVGIHGFH